MKCRKCGQSLYIGAKICPNCNAYLSSNYHGIPDKKNSTHTVGRQPSRQDTSYSYRPDKSTARHVVNDQSARRDTSYSYRPDKSTARHVVNDQSAHRDTSYSYRPDKNAARHVVRDRSAASATQPKSTAQGTSTQPKSTAQGTSTQSKPTTQRTSAQSKSATQGTSAQFKSAGGKQSTWKPAPEPVRQPTPRPSAGGADSDWLKKFLMGGLVACMVYFGISYITEMNAPESRPVSMSDSSDYDVPDRVVSEDYYQIPTIEYTYPEYTEAYWETLPPPTETQPPPTEATPQTVWAHEQYEGEHRNVGLCKNLTRNAMALLIFMNDSSSSWTQQEIQSYIGSDIDPGLGYIEYHAAQYGYPISFDKCVYSHENGDTNVVQYSGNVRDYDSDTLCDDLVDQAAAWYGFGSKEEMIRNVQDYAGTDQVALIFCLDKDGRSYSTWNTEENGFVEHSVIFTYQDGVRRSGDIVPHEIMHLFGVEDMYSDPGKRVNRAAMAQRVCPTL